MSRITITEIAQLAGVSKATVSRVLNDSGRFSEKTREKVLRIVREQNYKTNRVAKSLRTKHSKTIGIIVPDITNEFFSKIVLAVENFCVPRGYSVFICNTSEDLNKEKLYLDDLITKGVDGIIYISGYGEVPRHLTIPTVCIDRKQKELKGAFIESDNIQGGFIATETLIKNGCKNILLLKDERNYISPMIDRMQGYKNALKKYNISFDEKLIVTTKIGAEASQEAISKAIEEGITFDGVFATTDWLALGTINALKKVGVDIPNEVKVIGFDNISAGEYSYPSLSTINQNKTLLGEMAADLLIQQITVGYENSEHLIPVQLIKRESI